MPAPIRVAACHAAPAFLSARDTTKKIISLIHAASRNRADLVVFPETFLPAFPIWSALRPPTQNHALFKKMAEQSVYPDGEEIQAIQSAAQEAKAFVSVGISEKARYSSGTLFNTNMIIGPDGRILNHHRKIMPTFFEKLTWAQGDGYGLKTVQTPFGLIGNLICGENTNPLAKYTLIAQGEQLHISTWPAVWPTRVADDPPFGSSSKEPINSDRVKVHKTSPPDSKGKNYDNVAANRTRAAAHSFEAKAFGVLCSGFLDEEAISIVSANSPSADHITGVLRDAQRGATMFLDPTGAPINGYTINSATGEKQEVEFLQNKEDILYADLDLGECIEGKQFHDVVGGYQRHDIFELKVNRARQKPIHFVTPPTVEFTGDN